MKKKEEKIDMNEPCLIITTKGEKLRYKSKKRTIEIG